MALLFRNTALPVDAQAMIVLMATPPHPLANLVRSDEFVTRCAYRLHHFHAWCLCVSVIVSWYYTYKATAGGSGLCAKKPTVEHFVRADISCWHPRCLGAHTNMHCVWCVDASERVYRCPWVVNINVLPTCTDSIAATSPGRKRSITISDSASGCACGRERLRWQNPAHPMNSKCDDGVRCLVYRCMCMFAYSCDCMYTCDCLFMCVHTTEATHWAAAVARY